MQTTIPDDVLPAVVDAHHHLWDLGRGHYPWLQEEYNAATFILGGYEELTQDFLPDDYLRASEGVRVLATVHIEAERTRTEQLDETRWLHDLSERWHFPNAVVAHAWLDRPDCEERLAAQLRYPMLRGIRCKPLTSPGPADKLATIAGSMRDPRWQDGLGLLQRHGLSLDLRVPFWHLEEAAAVLAQFPELPVALNHAGLPWDRSEEGLAHWRRGLASLAQACPRAMLKLSEFGLREGRWDFASNARVVADALAIFGAERCMFGSNFPVASLRIGYRPLLENLQAMLTGLDPAQRDAVFCRNALDFYRIASTKEIHAYPH